ncbi:MAG TPA: TlpA disulfide reductase family protein [Bacteroidia bacterium]|nr:TlpA disulfide reductase family protein [Bacteroidia bacterium]
MKFIALLSTLVFFAALNFTSSAQQPTLMKWDQLEGIMNSKSDTTIVINFWATWCAPCVKELPHFEQIGKENKNNKIKIILVSLDFKSQFEIRLKKFVSEKNLSSAVYLLDEPDYNTWIDKVSPSWNGSIPATLVINSKKGIREFYEKEFTYSELAAIVNPLIQK